MTDPPDFSTLPFEVFTAKDAFDLVRRPPEDGTRWGPWTYLAATKELKHDHHYFVDLEDMETSAAVLDWIAQVAGKGWITDADLGALVRGIDALLHLQSTRCSDGIEQHPPRRRRSPKGATR